MYYSRPKPRLMNLKYILIKNFEKFENNLITEIENLLTNQAWFLTRNSEEGPFKELSLRFQRVKRKSEAMYHCFFPTRNENKLQAISVQVNFSRLTKMWCV